jgi:uncharacterized protein (DUF1684 family)
MHAPVEEILELADWRRQMFDVYREVRARSERDAEAAWKAWRSRRDELFGSHPQSAIPAAERETFQGLSYFDYDPAARIEAELEPTDAGEWVLEASEGKLTLDCVGRALFDLYGKRQTLNLYWFRSYGGGLFLSFRDETSGKQTYGGCRYLLDTVKGADLGARDGRLVLDFNFAYQPSCSYDPRWICPLAPAANRMEVAVRAGERLGSGPSAPS